MTTPPLTAAGRAAAADVLERGAEVIRASGLHQGDWCDPGGPACCAAGAVLVAAGMTPDAAENVGEEVPQVVTEAWLALADDIEPGWDQSARQAPAGAIGTWNDTPGRTAAEVIATMRRVAEGQREAATRD